MIINKAFSTDDEPKSLKIDSGVTINIGSNVVVEPGVVIGYDSIQKPREPYKSVVNIGDNTIIRSGSIIYVGVTIGNNCMINHNVILRENTVIGDYTTIGDFTKCEGNTVIGSHTSIWTHSHLTAFMTIGDHVFIGPMFLTLNDPLMGYHRSVIQNLREVDSKFDICGPRIDDGVRIGGGVIVMPHVAIESNAVIGAGAVVTKDVEAGDIIVSSVAGQVRGNVYQTVPEDYGFNNTDCHGVGRHFGFIEPDIQDGLEDAE